MTLEGLGWRLDTGIRGRGKLRQVSQLFTTLNDLIIAIKHVLVLR